MYCFRSSENRIRPTQIYLRIVHRTCRILLDTAFGGVTLAPSNIALPYVG
nr:MAG TPA: hypothetical protein [Caudoviricetes sp.]